jgi:short-chain fatty acids transporter
LLQATGEVFGRIARRVTPNPFAFAILLTMVVAAAGIGLTASSPLDMVGHWYEGFWGLLTFSMQIVVVLVAGHVLATSPQARRLIARLSILPNSPAQAILLISSVAIVAGFLNWAIGLVTGAIMAVTVSASARARGIRVHYPLAAAAGYMGVLIFGSGFSSSAPLLSNTQGHFLVDEIGLVSLGQTIFTPYNLLTTVVFFVAIPLLLSAMHPAAEACREVKPEIVRAFEPDAVEPEAARDPAETLAQRLERSTMLALPLAIVGLGFVTWYLVTGGFALDLNSLNFLLVMTGLALYRTPIAYVQAVDRAVHTASGVILQFPFYAGIMGMMTLSGLVEVFAGAMVSISTPATLPITALFSAAFVNFFVPSAGGQWAVQGPIIVEAARSLDVPIGRMIMAFAYGDQLTNMVQPFWAIPLLGITTLQARDLFGYTAVAMLLAGVIFILGIGVLAPLLG